MNSPAASSDPSRNRVHLEIGSPGPKQPQLICWPASLACTMAEKKTTRNNETRVEEIRSQKPKISQRPSATSAAGSVRASGSTKRNGTRW